MPSTRYSLNASATSLDQRPLGPSMQTAVQRWIGISRAELLISKTSATKEKVAFYYEKPLQIAHQKYYSLPGSIEHSLGKQKPPLEAILCPSRLLILMYTRFPRPSLRQELQFLTKKGMIPDDALTWRRLRQPLIVEPEMSESSNESTRGMKTLRPIIGMKLHTEQLWKN